MSLEWSLESLSEKSGAPMNLLEKTPTAVRVALALVIRERDEARAECRKAWADAKVGVP